MRIMITGGGTGGHTSPALAVVEELQRRDPLLTLQWVGRKGAIEERVCKSNSIPFRAVPMEGWPRQNKLRRVVVGGKLLLSLARCFVYIRRFKPQLVMGFGGYVSLPLMLAAQRMGVPTAFHEQNKRLGMANAMAAERAAQIFLSFPETVGNYPADRAQVVGNPVRAGFISPPSREEACREFNLDPALPVVLVTGGSQGAQTLNRAMEEALPLFDSGEVQFIWLAGAQYGSRIRDFVEPSGVPVRVFTFIDGMPMAFAAADLIVSRAGASSTAEIAAMGRPSILVPFPHAADNHQEANAEAFVARGAAELLHDDACTGPRLVELIRQLTGDRTRLDAMAQAAQELAQPGAAVSIANSLLSLVFDDSGGD